MAVELNHTIVAARDGRAGATFLADVLGLPAPSRFGPFWAVEVDNGVTLDFADADGDADVAAQHYAFLISETEFDQVHGRIIEGNIAHWADPGRRHPGEINTNDGGRGVYFEHPDGHFLEVLTRPYGAGT